MDTSLRNRTALVCGASQGIGRACAHALAAIGARVIVVSRRADAASSAAALLPTPTHQAHASLAADLEDIAAVERLGEAALALAGGTVHILVHNTGGPPEGDPLANPREAYDRAFRGHVLSAQTLVHALVPGMQAAKFGRIITITSTSVKAPIPTLAISNTVRAALAAWIKTLAGEVGRYGITANNVLPGFTATERLDDLFGAWARAAGKSVEELTAQFIATIPARRIGTPEEIAAGVAFLASPAASYINGINLPIDGGRTPTL
jgi:3-oxoacyl-[acyl-carrier protein] reductase